MTFATNGGSSFASVCLRKLVTCEVETNGKYTRQK